VHAADEQPQTRALRMRGKETKRRPALSIGSSTGPTPRIWKKWSMTQIESKPTSSAAWTMRASVGPIAASPPGHVKDGI